MKRKKELELYTFSYYNLDPNHPQFKQRVIHTKEFDNPISSDEVRKWAKQCLINDGDPKADGMQLEMTSKASLILTDKELLEVAMDLHYTEWMLCHDLAKRVTDPEIKEIIEKRGRMLYHHEEVNAGLL